MNLFLKAATFHQQETTLIRAVISDNLMQTECGGISVLVLMDLNSDSDTPELSGAARVSSCSILISFSTGYIESINRVISQYDLVNLIVSILPIWYIVQNAFILKYFLTLTLWINLNNLPNYLGKKRQKPRLAICFPVKNR